MRLVYWSLRSTATFVICFHWSLLLAFSLHFSSSSAFYFFLRYLFTQSSHLSCGLPHFLKPSFTFNGIVSVVTGYDLNCVNKYISKLYENISALVYEEREDGEKKWLNLITSVRSFEGETLQLSNVRYQLLHFLFYYS